MPFMYDKDVRDEAGLKESVARSAENCTAFGVRVHTNMPRYCPLAIQIMHLLDLEHPVFAGPYLGFECSDYNKEGRERCPLRDAVEEMALELPFKNISDKAESRDWLYATCIRKGQPRKKHA